MVVGGWDGNNSLSSVEFFPASDACSIPDLPQPRSSHSLSLLSGGRLVVCGGYNGGSLDSCISWVAGNTSWTPFHTMSVRRSGPTAWTPPSLPDSIVLLGGCCSCTLSTAEFTAETVPGGGSFGLHHNGYEACGIPDAGDTIVLTGGKGHNYVTRYDVIGFMEELPQLPENRNGHACAAIPATGALVVAGGEGYISSVLTLLPGAADWTPLASLPRPLDNARASIVGGRLRLVGGRDDGSSYRSEVLEYHPQPWNQWLTIGRIQQERYDHAVLSVGSEQLPCLTKCPPLPPSPGHLCATPAGALDCQYESFINNFGGNVNCCCGRCDSNVTCAPDSTTGSGFWQPTMYSTLCPAEGCGSEGEYDVDGFVKTCVEIIVKNSLHRCGDLTKPPWQLFEQP